MSVEHDGDRRNPLGRRPQMAAGRVTIMRAKRYSVW